MSDETTTAPVEIDAEGITVVLSPETEAHRRHLRNEPETEAHRRHLRDVPETEAHGFSMSPADPALDAYARIRLSFPPDAPEQTFELRYRPSSTPGQLPEVEVHACRPGR
jgi:hypothetical protein